jgi:polysaccharide pyruvyl transferase WcaK-like protein
MDFPVRRDPYFRHPVKLLRDYLATQWFGMRPRGEDKRAFWAAFKDVDVVVNCYAISFHRKKGDRVHGHPFLAAVRRVFDFYGISILARLTRRLSVKSTSSYGPMSTDYEKWLAKLSSRLAFHCFIARERESAEEFMRIVSPRDSVPVAPDVGNLMPPGGAVEIVHGRVGIAVSFRIIREWDGRAEDYIACIADLISYVRTTYGCTVLLIPNQLTRSEGPNDTAIADMVSEKLRDHSDVETFDAVANGPQAMKRAIVSCEVLVSSRYHASVAGLSSGVPQLVIGWHRKYGELMELYGQGKWMMSTEEVSTASLRGLFDALWRDRAAIRAKIMSRRDALRETVINEMRLALERGKVNG